MKKLLIVLVFFGLTTSLYAADEYQKLNEPLPELLPPPVDYSVRRDVRVPTLPGLKTLRCDFHMHTTYSDGKVSPEFRVQEAWHDGLDAIAITDHTENGHKKKGNLDEVFTKTKPVAEKQGILLIQAIEIAGDGLPPGHLNVLFTKKSEAARGDFKEWRQRLEGALASGGYVIWNHPGWSAQQKTLKMWPLHQELIKAGKIQAVEILNDAEWYPGALDWCADYQLAPVACTDVHEAIGHRYRPEALRPMTLVFAKENTETALREGLEARRTVGFFADKLVGMKSMLEPLVASSVRLQMVADNRLQIENLTDVALDLQGTDADVWKGTVKLAGRGSAVIQLTKPISELPVVIRNWHISGSESLQTKLTVK